jgi:hypothetical protein
VSFERKDIWDPSHCPRLGASGGDLRVLRVAQERVPISRGRAMGLIRLSLDRVFRARCLNGDFQESKNLSDGYLAMALECEATLFVPVNGENRIDE